MDPFQYLPYRDVRCETIFRTTDIVDISRIIRVSRDYHRLAGECVRTLTSNQIEIVPATFFSSFPLLKTLDPKITISVDHDNIGSLPILNELNVVIQYRNLIDPLLEKMNPQGKYRIIMTNFAGYLKYFIIIQEGKYVVFPPKSYITIPTLELIELPKIAQPGFNTARYMKLSFRNFLRHGDFGLIYPDLRPSPSNPTVSTIAQSISINNFATTNVMIFFLFIYTYYHQLFHGKDLHMDHVMEMYFGNQLGSGTMPLNADVLTHDKILKIVSSNIIRNNITIEDSLNFNINSSNITLDQLNAIDLQLKNTMAVYRRLRRQARNDKRAADQLGQPYIPDPNLGFYRTDGSFTTTLI